MRLVSSILHLLLASGCLLSAALADQCAYSNRQLPKNIHPRHYDLTFDVDTTRSSYQGTIAIDLTVEDEPEEALKNVIVLQAAPELHIDEVRYRTLEQIGQPGEPLDILDSCRDEKNELLVVRLKDDLVKGALNQLEVTFRASIRTDPTGIYRIGYKNDADGSEEVLVKTRLAPGEARKAFPCFDEPSFDASLDLTLIHSSKESALANTDFVAAKSNEAASERKTSQFSTMAASSLAFVIGKLETVEKSVDGPGFRVRASTVAGKSQQAQFALDTATRAIPLIEDYFATLLPLEKIDLVAIPWRADEECSADKGGLMTCVESSYLFEEGQTSPSMKSYIAINVVKGLVEQLLGSWVTFKRQEDSCLKEGLVVTIQDFIVNQLYPEYKLDHLAQSRIRVSLRDNAFSRRSIMRSGAGAGAGEKGTVGKLFYEVDYSKCSSIMRQLKEVYVGEENFKRGLWSFLKRHQGGTVEASDLWDELKAASGLPVDRFMATWLTQPRYPLVRARLGANKGKLALKQEPHLPGASLTWMIPITVLVSDGQAEEERLSFTFDQKTMEVELPEWFDASNSKHWLVLNDNSAGFYRVLYEGELFDKLAEPCKTKKLTLFVRDNLISDLLGLFNTEIVELAQLRRSLSWFQNETDGLIVNHLILAFKAVRKVTEGRIAKWKLHALGKKLFHDAKRAAHIPESSMDDFARSLLVSV